MSFSASAKRAKDGGQPVGRRVMCLHECLEQFSLFGYHDTRDRLRARLGVSDAGWTQAQLVAAVDAMEHARRSWMRFLTAGQERHRTARRQGQGARPFDERALRAEWLTGYLQGQVAEDWLVAGLGNCPECGHGMILHGGYACGACTADAYTTHSEKAWAQRCRVPLPPPGGQA